MAMVTDLQYVALAVPDLEAERTFFSSVWGLEEGRRERWQNLFRCRRLFTSLCHPASSGR